MKEGWKYMKLGEVCEILDSKRKPITKSKRQFGEIPYYGATGLLDYVKDFIFDEKLVLLGEDGAKWGAGEISAYIIEGKSWVNNHAHALRPKRQYIMDELLTSFLNFSDLSVFITGVTVPKLNQEKMRSIIVPVPPLPDQQRIVSYLDAEFAKIEALKSNAEKQLQAAKDLFQKELDQKLQNKKWNNYLLSDICTQITDGTHKTPKYTENGIPFLSVKNITSGYLDFKNTKYISLEEHQELIKRCNPKYGDILYSKVGTTGVAKVIDCDNDFSIFVSLALLKIRKELVYNYFLEYVLNSPYVYKQSQKLTSGAANRNFLLTDIKKVVVYLPNISEQQRIADRLDALSANVKALQTNYAETITLCNDLKQALLKKVFG